MTSEASGCFIFDGFERRYTEGAWDSPKKLLNRFGWLSGHRSAGKGRKCWSTYFWDCPEFKRALVLGRRQFEA